MFTHINAWICCMCVNTFGLHKADIFAYICLGILTGHAQKNAMYLGTNITVLTNKGPTG